jgi:hypothetical protein
MFFMMLFLRIGNYFLRLATCLRSPIPKEGTLWELGNLEILKLNLNLEIWWNFNSQRGYSLGIANDCNCSWD